jgi:hypothetical protein
MKLTPETIAAATLDAGTQHMEEGGRTAWDKSDQAAAATESNRLWEVATDNGRLAMFGPPGVGAFREPLTVPPTVSPTVQRTARPAARRDVGRGLGE